MELVLSGDSAHISRLRHFAQLCDDCDPVGFYEFMESGEYDAMLECATDAQVQLIGAGCVFITLESIVEFTFLTQPVEPIPTVHVRRRFAPEKCMICLEDTTCRSWCCRNPVHRDCLQEWLNRRPPHACPQKCGGNTCPQVRKTTIRRHKNNF